ncbi:SPFH domain-containing protein [Jatrophihabitans telluris]|uniref:SPFH domain-containing protein n=1 Tax=Jatrophihabitans telluris TaxID=2038343 RepID=A0ABY4QVV6_9ACTN|nr:SPFH domain-containing protein [Jatrophihabitans telluris]UQX87392.1 SPFH domain-containing protein [Jatrophihabitans telluris]
MPLFVLFFILLLTAIALLVASRRSLGAASILRLTAIGVAVVAIISLFFSTFTTVGTKNLGVKTIGGRPVGYLTNGYHFKEPWVTVTELTNAVQTDTYASDGYGKGPQGGANASCINVRIARQATACVNVSIRWQATGTGIDYLFRNFKDNEKITDNLVLRDLQQAMNEQFTAYDPLGIDNNGNSTNRPLSSAGGGSYSSAVLAIMRNDIGQWIDVQSVIVPLLNFDPATQDRINQLQQQVAQTRIAVQAKLTADAQAAANRALAASVNNNPGVLTSRCLDILQDAVNKGQALPAGFSCFGASTTGIAVSGK